MKKALLSFLLCFSLVAVFAQQKFDTSVSVYPNPATDFISVSNDELAKNVIVFNVLGRKLRSFDIQKGEQYEISDLPNGLYLVQVMGKNNKVLSTQRLTKKS
jgi:hypothetical protein